LINIQNSIINGNLNNLISEIINNDNKEGIVKEINNNIYQIAIIDNKIKNENNNYSTIDIGECENKLRNFYNIPKNISLILFKIDFFLEGYTIPIVQY